jgi:hypothetical protein
MKYNPVICFIRKFTALRKAQIKIFFGAGIFYGPGGGVV